MYAGGKNVTGEVSGEGERVVVEATMFTAAIYMLNLYES